MSPCSLSLGQGLRILEMVFCALALIIPMFRGSMSSPYGIWCEFVWVFGLVVAVVIFVIEKCLVDKLIETLVLKHTWDDLSCGLTLLASIMLLSASLIYSTVFVCSTCIADMICASASILACGVRVGRGEVETKVSRRLSLQNTGSPALHAGVRGLSALHCGLHVL